MISLEQRQFAGTVHDLLSGADVPAAARAWATGDRAAGLDVWRRLAKLGVTALAVPERFDGLGADAVDLVVVCEELGHHALPGPVAESVAAVPVLLGDTELASTWLPRLAGGEALATLAAPPRLPYAADADAADLVLLVDGSAVHEGQLGAAHRSLDETRWLGAVTPGPLLATGATAGRALDAGTLACAAQLLGAGRALLEMTVRYAGQRVQFGQPIGGFQAVAHQLADVRIGLDLARPLLFAAAGAFDAGCPTAARDVSAAAVACAAAAHRAARTALQAHGAIGYTRELDLWLWLTKVRALVPAWGSLSWHRARVMAALAWT